MLKQKRRLAQHTNDYGVFKHADARLSNYPYTLNFYQSPPPFEISLEEFETFSLDRLRVLKAIETSKLRHKKEQDVFKGMESAVNEYLDLFRNTTLSKSHVQTMYEQRKKDHISHFLLRLAFCRTEELRAWFTRLECTLFKYRYLKEEPKDREMFLKSVELEAVSVPFKDIVLDFYSNHLNEPETVQSTQKTRVLNDFKATYLMDPELIKTSTFYRVPFDQVLELVSKRSVILRDGMAYVPESERILLVMNAFKNCLVKGLEETARALPRLEEDDRLTPIINSLAKQQIGTEYKASGDAISSSDVDNLVTHFPPCMRNLHYSLRGDGHLKHFGRLQYGLFLKGIGLQVEEALVFWRKAFLKKTDDEFQKQYAYGVRYNYGMEGARKNYTPYSCIKIITTNGPSSGDHHGCPFKHFSPDNLKSTLIKYGANESGVLEIIKTAKEGHYQVACTKFFEITHSMNEKLVETLSMGVIEHPNAWFDLSFKGSLGSKDDSNKE